MWGRPNDTCFELKKCSALVFEGQRIEIDYYKSCFHFHPQESNSKEKFEPKHKTKGRSSSKKQHLRKKGHEQQEKKVSEIQSNPPYRKRWQLVHLPIIFSA